MLCKFVVQHERYAYDIHNLEMQVAVSPVLLSVDTSRHIHA